MTVLYPPIQEERRIRSNIALGPSGLGQYYSVSSSPLGLGGTIRTQFGLFYLSTMFYLSNYPILPTTASCFPQKFKRNYTKL